LLGPRRRNSIKRAIPDNPKSARGGPTSYVPVQQIGDRPHVMVDGAARPGTVMTLSHWPRSSTPKMLRRDLSAQIVLRALETGYASGAGTDLATIDHYDEDGVLALGLLLTPGLAEVHGEIAVEAARVGDFGVVRERRAALVAFALATLADPQRTPINVPRHARDPKTGRLEMCGLATEHALSMLEDLVSDPQSFETLWRDEAAAFDAAVAGMGKWVRLEELPDHDLAIVRVEPGGAAARSASWGEHVIHPASVNSSTARLRVAMIADDRLEVRFRYESWVRLASRRPRPRVDLSGLVSSLDKLEPDGARWCFDGAGATHPVLRTIGGAPSGISPDQFVESVVEHLVQLDDGPPAWDPYLEVV
jgi:hypothetical protein